MRGLLLRSAGRPVAAKPSQLRPSSKPFLDPRRLILLGNIAAAKALGQGISKISATTQGAQRDIGLAFHPLVVDRVIEPMHRQVGGLWFDRCDAPLAGLPGFGDSVTRNVGFGL